MTKKTKRKKPIKRVSDGTMTGGISPSDGNQELRRGEMVIGMSKGLTLSMGEGSFEFIRLDVHVKKVIDERKYEEEMEEMSDILNEELERQELEIFGED